MRFSVDAHAIGQKLTGNEVYVRNLLNGFAALDRSSEFIAYVSANVRAEAAVPSRFRQRFVSSNSFVRLGLDLTQKVRQDRPDLLHVQYTAPLGCPVPVVVSVHDVSFLEHPEYFPWARAKQLRITVKRTIRRAAKVITPSEFSRRAIVDAYGLDDSRIAVVPIAMSPAFRPLNRDVARATVRTRFGISSPYVLTVGDLQPRKNQTGLINAFEQLIRANPKLPHHLVLVGKKSWLATPVIDAAHRSFLADRIHFTGFVADDDLLPLYNAADLMVFPSLYEGFGLPVLDSMACGCPVACSRTSAIPEVADSAALLFDPVSADSIAACMRDVLVDPELRFRLQRLGQQRASLFSWEQTARRTLRIYYEVAGLSPEACAEPVRSTQSVRR